MGRDTIVAGDDFDHKISIPVCMGGYIDVYEIDLKLEGIDPYQDGHYRSDKHKEYRLNFYRKEMCEKVSLPKSST